MIRENFFDAIENMGNDIVIVTIYNTDEITGRFKMIFNNIEEYDDEIVIRGADNDFVILDGSKITEAPDEYDKIEFLFGAGENKIGVMFY